MQTIEEKLQSCYQDLDNALQLKDWSFLSSHQQQVRQVINEALQHGASVSEEVMDWLDKLQALYQKMENACKAEKIHIREQMSVSKERIEVIDTFLDSTADE